MWRVVVQRVGDHGLLRGEGGKNRATQGVIIDVQHSIDYYFCAACVTTHVRGYMHTQGKQYMCLSASG